MLLQLLVRGLGCKDITIPSKEYLAKLPERLHYCSPVLRLYLGAGQTKEVEDKLSAWKRDAPKFEGSIRGSLLLAGFHCLKADEAARGAVTSDDFKKILRQFAICDYAPTRLNFLTP